MYSHASWKSTDKWSLTCSKSILKISNSNYFQFSVFNFQFSIFNFQFLIFNLQFSVFGFQFLIKFSIFRVFVFLKLNGIKN